MPNLSQCVTSDRLLRPVEVQVLLGVAATTLWNYSNAGLLRPAQRTAGGHARYLEADVLAFKAELVKLAGVAA